jgi:hypothetical protein
MTDLAPVVVPRAGITDPYQADDFLRTMRLMTPEERVDRRQQRRDFIKLGRVKCRRCKRMTHRGSFCDKHIRTCLTCCTKTYPNPTHPLPKEAS